MSVLHTSQEHQRPEPSEFVSNVAGDAGREQQDQALENRGKRAILGGSVFRKTVLSRLERLEIGTLLLQEDGQTFRFGKGVGSSLAGKIVVRSPKFYRSVVLGGDLGAAESYIQGEWDSPDLTTSMRVLAQNSEALSGVVKGPGQWLAPLRSAANWLRRNTRSGSRRNIAAHYDLSNDFFALMLDPTMTYSSGVFPAEDATLKQASVEKYDRICRKLQLTQRDRVIEIGTGWGGFAEHAVRNYGCHVTTTTISSEQHAYAESRFRNAGLSGQINLLQQDYRDLTGQYDKLVSIEMIEAVGQKYLPGYFEKCSSLLMPDGMMVLQAITMPDYRYDAYRKGVDFIQRYIFPGGFLPSMSAITNCLRQQTDLTLSHSEDFASHYALTLAQWRSNFCNSIDAVKTLGFDQRFVRTWNYYLCYCEAGFHERQVGVSQLLMTKPANRRECVLADVHFTIQQP